MMSNEKDEPRHPVSAVSTVSAVSDWMVERLAAKDLPADRAAEVMRRLASEPGGQERLQQRLDGIAASNQEILAAHPPALVAAEIRRRAVQLASSSSSSSSSLPFSFSRATSSASFPGRRPGRRGWRLGIGAPVLAAALVAIFWLRPGPVSVVQSGRRSGSVAKSRDINRDVDRGLDRDTERIKGLRPSLRVYRKVGEAVERLAPGVAARAGDQLQLAYVAAGQRFGAVLSVDGAGQVTFHLPATPGPAARLATDGEVALADAYELDAAPGFERFVFVSSGTPFDASSLAEVVRGKAPPPPGITLLSFTVRKQ